MNEGTNELPGKDIRAYTKTEVEIIKFLLYQKEPLTAYKISEDKFGRERKSEVKNYCEDLCVDGFLLKEGEPVKYSLNRNNKVIDFLIETVKLSSKGDNKMIEICLEMFFSNIRISKDGKGYTSLSLDETMEFVDKLKASFPPDQTNIQKLGNWLKKFNAIMNPRN